MSSSPKPEERLRAVFIGISGMIGAGKSTLATALGDKLGLPVYYEALEKDNVYLEDFYVDMKKHAFAMQVHLLNQRFSQQQALIWSGRGGVMDRTIYEDSVFAKMLRNAGYMDERDYQTYVSLFNHMERRWCLPANFMKTPSIIVHLDVKPEESLRRIRSRARACEAGITLEYLTALYAAYDEFLKEISRVVPVLKVDWQRFRSTEEVAEKIAQEYALIANVREVRFDPDTSLGGSLTPRLPVKAPAIDGEGKGAPDNGGVEASRPEAAAAGAGAGVSSSP